MQKYLDEKKFIENHSLHLSQCKHTDTKHNNFEYFEYKNENDRRPNEFLEDFDKLYTNYKIKALTKYNAIVKQKKPHN